MRQAYDYWQDQPGSFRRGSLVVIREHALLTLPRVPATQTVHKATVGSYCFLKRFLTKLRVCLHLRVYLNGNRTRKATIFGLLGRNVLLGRENVLRCELTDSHNAHYKRSDTRRAHVLLSNNFWHRLFVQLILPRCTGKIRLCMSHQSQRITGTCCQYPRASA